MKNRQYWLDLFTWETWNEFLKAGATVSGFRERKWKNLQRTKPGDYFLCYITGASRFIGVLEITSKPFKDETPIWGRETFPCRVNVKLVEKLEIVNAVPVVEMKEQLSFFQDLKNPLGWTGLFRGSPNLFKDEDGNAIVEAIFDAKKNPIERPYEKKSLDYKPKKVEKKRKSKKGKVKEPISVVVSDDEKDEDKTTKHTLIQWKLLKLGADMGLQLWVAANDKSKEYQNHKLGSIKGIKKNLPSLFPDNYSNRIVEMIDVMWFDGDSLVAAFEIEDTTSIYSGLLRMADIVASNPHLTTPIFIVADEKRKDKVREQINRPIFTKGLRKPLYEVCGYISYSSLDEAIDRFKGFYGTLKPIEFLLNIADTFETEDIEE